MHATCFKPEKDIPSLEGKVILVTGGNVGLGKQAILDFASHRPRQIWLAARNVDKANEAIEEIRAQVSEAPVKLLQMDLSSFESVKKAAETFAAESDRLDILMLNAGIMATSPALTKDGYEMQFGTNHMGHALLTKLLMPVMIQTAKDHADADVRVVCLSSIAHKQAPKEGIVFDSLKTEANNMGAFERYGQSKMANILYAKQLAKEYPQLTVSAVHPGVVRTNLASGMSGMPAVVRWMSPLANIFFTPVDQGAKNQLWASVSKGVESGEYYEPVGVGGKCSSVGNSEELAKNLWDWTEEELRGWPNMNTSILHKAVAPIRMLAQSPIVVVVRDYSCKGARYHSPASAFPRPAKRRLITPLARRKGTQRGFHTTGPLRQNDPYQTLGVNKSSSAGDIKKAYYGLAKKYHPDTNKDPTAKDRFSEIQSAYEILSDPQKREQYDQFGAAAFDPSGAAGPGAGNPFSGGFQGFGGKGGGFPFEEIFEAFTGQSSSSSGRRRARSPFESAFNSPFETQEIFVGENIEVFANITFAEAAKGTVKRVTTTPMTPCDSCSGSGLKSGAKRSQCKNCNGTGTRLHFMHGGMQMASQCNTCSGTGSTIPKGSHCTKCSGNGVIRDRVPVQVEIPAGIEDGMRLKFEGAGDAPAMGREANPNSPSQRGDLYVCIRVARDSRFERDGADLRHRASIPFTTALLGGQVDIPTVDGTVKVKVATGTGTGDVQTLSGMGMKRLGKRSGWGDLKVVWRVNMPTSLTANQRTLMEMMADEMGDKSARRVMNVSPSSTQAEGDHNKHEGFLKSIWHSLTKNQPAPPPNTDDTTGGKKKSSDSGSG
ncbi:hypothetical protein L249_8090 [Ophiocordyceps polyrhachis-furcata BCC 54312]|uniref:DnaJ homolog 1, mitochondrial n=1 Tax=Ophiocordyceps polyrhachis-furcata BCC 54312 TaxID=1330021 RepID=A0A367LI08_9HYPO|nr:hypothetical protein L249_8090 [Ophiocordyceps polyrhachis-furcata BCC 54312]